MTAIVLLNVVLTVLLALWLYHSEDLIYVSR